MEIFNIIIAQNTAVSWAAFLGTTVHLLNGKKRKSREMIVTVLSNYLTAIYLAGLVASLINLAQYEVAVSFGIAVGGMKYVEKILERLLSKIDSTLNNDFTNLNEDGNPNDISN